MAVVWLKSGDGEKPYSERSQKMRTILSQAVAAKAGEFVQQVVGQSNPVQGVRGHLARSTWLPWGVCIRRRMQPGLTSLGDRTKNPATKSSTMKGAKALGSKF